VLLKKRIAMALSGLLAVAGVAVPAGPAHAAVACDVSYSVTPSSPFTANLLIRNLGDPWNGWTLQFVLPSGQTLIPPGWSATWSQSGQNVTATPLAWNSAIPTGGSTQIGFQGTWFGSLTSPTAFIINGVTCAGAGGNQPPAVSITNPPDNSRFAAPASFILAATASDAAPGLVSKVEFFRDGLLLGTDTASPYSWSITALPVGVYVLQAKATDNGGATATSSVAVTVEQSQAPAIQWASTAVTVPEGGSTTVGLRLSAAPSGDVWVAPWTLGDASITFAPWTLLFTPTNWQTFQDVTLSAAEDNDTVSGTTTVMASATGYPSVGITATESDNDTNVTGNGSLTSTSR
jgi:hypothetical protein